MTAAQRKLPDRFLPRALGWLDRRLARATRGRVRLYLYCLVAQPVPMQPLLQPARGRNIDVRDVSREESETIEFPRPRTVIRQRFANGGQCLGAFKDGRLVGFLWLQREAYEEDEVRCLFLPTPSNRAVWDYDVYIEPEFRFSTVFARLWDEAFARLRRESIAWTMSRVTATNVTSLAPHVRLKARSVGTVLFLRLGPTQLTLTSSRPYIHFALGSRSQPKITIRA